ncbi:1171_t:CDS:2 [Funneliformis geosporum]|uniref:5936_t:CDS:1 n=1 Tax=Funneliformis geosporum TaxID=1117311 RepID=A0A9W4SND8_9GLOM|nr:1171_t:CDS:2 [Funneliformis geosporum]CAI2173324.1 5936_t:CDS:2 [Funneliformis geosporum]
MNVRNYYAELGQDKAQAIIDEITKAYERAGQSGFPPQYGYIPGIPPPTAQSVPGAAPPQYGGAPMPPMMLGRPPAGAGAPGTVPAPGLSIPPPGLGSAPPGMVAPGVVGPPQSMPMIKTEPSYLPMKIVSPGIRPSIVSPTNATSLGPGSQGNIPPGGVPGSVPPPGSINYQQYPIGHPSQHYPPVGGGLNVSGPLALQSSRGVKRQMEE